MILKNKLVKNTSWTAVSFIVVSLVYVLRLSILTRFLSKEDFGLIALTLFVLGFTNIFADLGISTVILSKDNLTKKEYSSLYWVGILLSIVLYMLLLVIAPFFSNFYKEPMLMNLIPVMGIDLIISTMGRQFNTYMQKEFRFKTIAIIKIGSEIGSLVLALILALNGFGIWSLIVSLLTASLMNALGSIILEYKFHPLQLYCNIKKTKHLYSIGLYQTGAQILDYISSQIDVLLLGKLLPLGDMGVYSIIKTLVVRIYSSVNQVFTKVTVPLLAKAQFDYKLLKVKYMGIIQIIGIINAFLFLLFIVNSELVLNVFYGEKLMNYSWVFAILCVWGYFSSIVNCAGGIIIATGSTRIGFVWTQIRLLINPIFILVGGYYWGMLGVCISQAIYSILVILLYYRLVIFRIIKNISITDFIKCFYKPTLYSSAIYFFTFGISFIFGSSLNPYVYLSITIIVATLCFYLLLKKDLFKSILLFKE